MSLSVQTTIFAAGEDLADFTIHIAFGLLIIAKANLTKYRIRRSSLLFR